MAKTPVKLPVVGAAPHPVITELDRREASAVTVQGTGHVFEIQLGHLCNNRCVFCSSGMLTQEGLAKPVPLDDILAAIAEAKAAGARRLIFLGGEPTLHKGFLTALEHTVAVGFEDIVIFTNGVLLPQPGFIDKVVALGNFEWRISIQGADEASHVAVTGRKQSFRRIMTGLDELARRGQRVTMNMCVNEHSYRSLPGYPELIREHGIAQVHIDIIRPASTGRDSLLYFEEIMPRYSTMAPYLEQMLDGFEVAQLGVEVSVGNMPYCVLRRWPAAVFHGGEDTVTVASDGTGLEPEVDKYAWHAAMRQHVPACEGCVMREDCTGVFATYLELHGDAEFVAYDEAELLALPPARRPFSTLMRRCVGGLLAALEDGAEGLEGLGFAFEQEHDERLQRSLGLTFCQLGGGGRVTLRFESPEHSGASTWAADGAVIVAREPAWRLAVVVDRSVPEPSFLALLDWALGHAAVDAEGARAAWAKARSLAPLRARAGRTLARLREATAPRGWTWASRPAAASKPRPELGLRVQGPEPGRFIDLVLELSPPAGIELDFRRGPSVASSEAEGLIAELVAMLKALPRAGKAGARTNRA